jgi:hypothetical protein
MNIINELLRSDPNMHLVIFCTRSNSAFEQHNENFDSDNADFFAVAGIRDIR